MKKVMDVKSESYQITGELLIDEEDIYYIRFILNDKEHLVKGYNKKYVDERFLPDYAWMSLEEAYEDIILSGVE